MNNPEHQKSKNQQIRNKLGLDLPIFYVSITDLASSDTLI